MTQLTEDRISAACCCALDALAYLHSRRILHRDVKAANLLLSRTGQLRLADFGVATHLSSGFTMGASGAMSRHTLAGSPYWMAPEVAQACLEPPLSAGCVGDKAALPGGYGAPADVWSLGVTAIELAEGAPPLCEMGPHSAIHFLPLLPSPTLRQPAAWSTRFCSFLVSALAKQPGQRADVPALRIHEFYTDGDAARRQGVLRHLALSCAPALLARRLLREREWRDRWPELGGSRQLAAFPLSPSGKEHWRSGSPPLDSRFALGVSSQHPTARSPRAYRHADAGWGSVDFGPIQRVARQLLGEVGGGLGQRDNRSARGTARAELGVLGHATEAPSRAWCGATPVAAPLRAGCVAAPNSTRAGDRTALPVTMAERQPWVLDSTPGVAHCGDARNASPRMPDGHDFNPKGCEGIGLSISPSCMASTADGYSPLGQASPGPGHSGAIPRGQRDSRPRGNGEGAACTRGDAGACDALAARTTGRVIEMASLATPCQRPVPTYSDGSSAASPRGGGPTGEAALAGGDRAAASPPRRSLSLTRLRPDIVGMSASEIAEEMAALPSKYARDVERVRRRHAKMVAALLAERAKKVAGTPPASGARESARLGQASLVGELGDPGSSTAAVIPPGCGPSFTGASSPTACITSTSAGPASDAPGPLLLPAFDKARSTGFSLSTIHWNRRSSVVGGERPATVGEARFLPDSHVLAGAVGAEAQAGIAQQDEALQGLAPQRPTSPHALAEEAKQAQPVVRAKYGTAPRELSRDFGRLASRGLEVFKHKHPVRGVNLRTSV